jgi:dinuclear metal center YbgI/SA1388 family protein
MNCKEVIDKIEQWAPGDIAWDRDNTGLQVGSVEREIKKILLSLDLTEPVLEEAISKKCNLIITHHPLLFTPLKRIDTLKNHNSKLIEKLIKNDITLYSAHTNLDYTKDGVSFELAKKLNLQNIKFLLPIKSNQSKIVVFVPAESLDTVAQAVFNSGGGIIGDYSNCSFRTGGAGTFRGSEKTNPAVGEKEKFETVEENRLEIIAENWKTGSILSAIKKVHPYEEPAVDIYPLHNINNKFGVGAVGELENYLTMAAFLDKTAGDLQIKNFRYSGKKDKIKTVAVCGGSGAEYLKDAIQAGADAFITADVKYHSFHEAEEKILFIDAGHYETEIFALDAIERYLRENFKNLSVNRFSGNANPVNFYNNQGA